MPRGIKKTKITIDNLNNDSMNEPKDTSLNEVKKTKVLTNFENKYPSRTLEQLREIDFINQYEGKLPKIKIPGYVVAWICNTPNKSFRDTAYKDGYDYLDINQYPPVASGYSDASGEDRYAHYAMAIPQEIYDRKQKALQDMTNKMYAHILKPDSKREEREGDGMYNPGKRTMQTVAKVLEAPQS